MADSFVRRLRILEMLKRKDEGTVSIPEIIHKLKVAGHSDIMNMNTRGSNLTLYI